MASISSDSSSSEDEIIEQLRRIRRPKIYLKRNKHFEKWNNKEFHARFRLNKASVLKLLYEVENNLKYNSARNQCLTPMDQLLLGLRFFATGNMLISIGDFIGVSKATASRTVRKVAFAIASLHNKYITMPTSNEEINAVAKGFYKLASFPLVIGTIDCTHIKIQSPGGQDSEVYRNRKGYFSYNVQTVSDADLKIRNIVARWPGSCHDQTIYNNSKLKTIMTEDKYKNYVLLGDNGYPCTNNLITPILNPNNRGETLYNEAHIRTRNTVERQYGVWKRRFPILSLGMRVSTNTAKLIIVATAVLHNLAIKEKEEMPPNENDEVPREETNTEETINYMDVHIHNNTNYIRRNMLINYFNEK